MDDRMGRSQAGETPDTSQTVPIRRLTPDGGCYTVTVEVGSWLDDGWGRDHVARVSSPCLVAPKGKATRRNSQANGPQPDRALNAPHAARGQGAGYAAARGSPAALSFLMFSYQPSADG